MLENYNATYSLPFPANPTVLVVDDSISVRYKVQSILEDKGYCVHSAKDLVKQILTFSRQEELESQPLQPHMTGSELARKILAVQPEVPIFSAPATVT